MTLYRYKGIGKEGLLCKGTLEAASLSEFKNSLQQLDIALIGYSIDLPSLFVRGVKIQLLMDLCLHLEQFENAGISLKEGLEELYQIQSTPRLKAALNAILHDVKGGFLFSKALSKHPRIFDDVFVGLIASGEKTGQLTSVYQHIFHHLTWVDDLQAQTRKALRYPLIMIAVLLVALFMMMTVLVPELVKFIEASSTNIPLSTRLLISFASFCSTYILPSFVVLSLLISFLMLFLKCHPQGNLWKSHFLDRMPLISPLRKMIYLARFCHIFALMFESGIDILQALQTARKSLKAGQIYSALEEIEILVQNGFSLSSACQKGGIFPSLIIRMVKVGEQTSSLQLTLLHVKTYFDTTLKRRVDHLMGLIEPTMILSVGLVMAWIVYAIFLPLYDTLSVLDY